LLLDANGRSLVDDHIDRVLRARLPPLVSFIAILDGSDGCNSHEQSFEEEDHLLVLMDVNLAIIVEDVEANCDDDVEVWWLKDQEVLVLILEDELVDEGILLLILKIFLKLLKIGVASISKYLESSVSGGFVVAEDEVTQSEVWVREFVRRQ